MSKTTSGKIWWLIIYSSHLIGVNMCVLTAVPVISIPHSPLRWSNTLTPEIIKSLKRLCISKSRGNSILQLHTQLLWSPTQLHYMLVSMHFFLTSYELTTSLKIIEWSYQGKSASTWVISYDFHLWKMLEFVHFRRLDEQRILKHHFISQHELRRIKTLNLVSFSCEHASTGKRKWRLPQVLLHLNTS